MQFAASSRLLVLAGVLGAVPVLTAQQARQPAPEPVAIGVVRADGLLLPLATRRNNRWQALATDNGRGGSRLTADARRLASTGWQLIPASGSPRPFTLGTPEAVRFECSRTELFATSLETPQRLTGAETVKTLGLATRGPVNVERAVNVTRSTDDAVRNLRDLIASLLQSLEYERVRTMDSRLTPELTRLLATERTKRPVRIPRLFHHKDGPEDTYYFEAEKDYSEVRNLFAASGWIVTSGSESQIHGVASSFVDANPGAAGPPTEVLGVIPRTVDARSTVWVMTGHSNVDVIYSLYEIASHDLEGRRALSVSANHCTP